MFLSIIPLIRLKLIAFFLIAMKIDDPSDLNTEKNVSRFKITLKKKLEFALKQSVYAWKPIEFTSYVGKQYLLNRMPAEYAVLNRIFLEISNRCPEFTPSSLLDFGSGVGTVTR